MRLEKYKLEEMIKGWFIGNFEPSLYKTTDVEVGIKKYCAGDFENAHHHKIATEFTVIIKGIVEMNGVQYFENEIIKVNPGVITSFKAITDVVTVVVKLPGANNDKYE
jgi:hypothetical protein